MISMPSNSANFNTLSLLCCSMMAKICEAYCLLLSNSFLSTRFNSHGSNVVSETTWSANGGMNDKRFSKTPRMLCTPVESDSSVSSRRDRFETSRSSIELFSYASGPSPV